MLRRPLVPELRNKLCNSMRNQATLPISEAIEMIDPYFDFDAISAREKAVRRYIRNCAKRLKGEDNERTVFLLPERGLIVNTRLCRDPELIQEVREQMKAQLMGYRASYRSLTKRYNVLTGQITIDDIFKEVSS